MKISCLQENLSRGLGIVQRAVATRTTLPITQNVMLSTDNGRLKLAATNLEVATTTWVGAQVMEEGSVTLPARLLIDFVNSLPADRVDIELNEDEEVPGLNVRLKCARFRATINGQSVEDYPSIPTVEEGEFGRIDAHVLRDAINSVGVAAATEDSRPVLQGIRVEMSGEDVTFAAADGYRLAIYRGKMSSAIDGEISFTAPAKSLQEVVRLLGQSDNPVEFTVTPARSQALFRLDNVELVSQLIQGQFPNFEQLVPDTHDTRTVISLDSFSRATRTAAAFARDGSGIIRLNMSTGTNGSGGSMAVSSRAEEMGMNTGQVDADVEGEDGKIAFNSRFLREVLDVLECEQVALETTSPSSPGVIKPAEEGEAFSYVHIVMPMFVDWG